MWFQALLNIIIWKWVRLSAEKRKFQVHNIWINALVCFEDDTKLVRTTNLFAGKCYIVREHFKITLSVLALDFGFCLQGCNMKNIIHSSQLGSNWNLGDISHSGVSNKGENVHFAGPWSASWVARSQGGKSEVNVMKMALVLSFFVNRGRMRRGVLTKITARIKPEARVFPGWECIRSVLGCGFTVFI